MGCPEDIQAAVELIEKAEKPLVVAGGGVWWSQAQKELKDFVEKSGYLYLPEMPPGEPFLDNHPLHMGIAAHMHPLFHALFQRRIA